MTQATPESSSPATAMDATPMNATVIDAGVGNLGNLVRALEHLGAEATLTTDPARIARSRCLVLPGVGAFRPPREALRGALEEALRQALDRGAYLLGICVGYQLLFEGSTEFGDTDGLGLLPGRIESLPSTVTLPQIGWNRLVGEATDHPLFDGIEAGSYFYFVHSFAPLRVPSEAVLARALHGAPFVAVARGRGELAERVFGTQFHPEKSGADGLRLIENYLALAHGRGRRRPASPGGAERVAEGAPTCS